ncbi:cytochrome P450 [Candidatus Palauibacter sp.]|uniref:cytochrome P450 n=1 Tax=Candidatus Palauibacter sp. TaxID=3101350 RepID=UPI003B016715
MAGRRLRNLIARYRDTLGLFRWLHREYGPIVRYRILGFEFCLLSDPELIEEVLYAKRQSFEKGFMYKRSLLLPRPTIITGDGEDHKRRRRLVQPYFDRRMLDANASIMAEQVVATRDEWRDGEILDMDGTAHELTLSISLEIFFGNTLQVDATMLRRVLKLCGIDIASAMLPSRRLRRLILSSFRRLRGAYRELAEQVLAGVQSARAEDTSRFDLVSYLARATDEDGEHAFSEEEVVDGVIEMLIASLTTTATTITWATYYLARNPVARERLEREVDETLNGRVPTFEDCERLRYTGAVISEVLRLAPPAYYLGRKATRDCTVGGYFIPAGANVQLFCFPSPRDERYFPHADEFRPERWLESQPARPRCSYMPFSSGTRGCAGEAFGRTNLTCALAGIAQQWRLDLVSEEFPKLNTLASYAFRDGLPVRASGRSQGS